MSLDIKFKVVDSAGKSVIEIVAYSITSEEAKLQLTKLQETYPVCRIKIEHLT